ncbi:MAG: putative Ig domain-containing protein [bacterium]|nr:putative Ig domain-containing protein [bacterium]
MRLFKIPLICIAIILSMSTMASAQFANVFLDCGDVSESSVDSIILGASTAPPGDTVWVPISLTSYDNPFTDYNEPTTGLFIMLQWDSTYLSPVPDPADLLNEGFLSYATAGRLKTALDTLASDSSDHIFMRYSQNPFDSNAIIIGFNLGLAAEVPEIESGSGVVLRIPFSVDPSMPDGATAAFRFYQVNECITIGGEIFCSDCRRTSMASASIDSIGVGLFDSTSLEIDTAFSTHTIYPELSAGLFTANTQPPPTIDAFTISPNPAVQSSAILISWAASNTDSVRITGPGFSQGSTLASGSIAANAPATIGTAQYIIKAFNEFDSAGTFVNLEVIVDDGGGGGGDNTLPTITVSPGFTVEEGQPLSFSVSATDIDGDDITLSHSGALPNNAFFPQAVGAGSVSSTFSWTPDIGQQGTYTINFTANDGTGTRTASVSITVTGITVDRLFTTSAPNHSPVGGLPGKKSVFLPIDLVTAQVVYGVQFDFRFDYNLFKVDSFVVTGRTPDYIVYDNIGQTPGLIKVVTLGLANEPVALDTTTAIMYAVMSIDSTATPDDYPVYIEDGWESVNPDPNFPSLELAVDSGVIQVDRVGDVNLDKRVNVADLVSIVAYIINNFSLSDRQFDAGDVLVNDTVNVFDLVGVVNLIYGIPLAPTPGQPIYNEMATVDLEYPSLAGGNLDEITVTSELPTDIAGVELEFAYDPTAMSLGIPTAAQDADQLTLRYRDDGYGKMVVLMHFKNPADVDGLVSAGLADLVSIPISARKDIESGNEAQIRLTRALLSTSDAAAVLVEGMEERHALPTGFTLKQNYPNPFNPITTIEFSVGVSSDGATTKEVSLDIYNILGRHVKQLVDSDMLPGNYRVEWDATSKNGARVATGIYLYRLRVGEEAKTKKMLLLK